MKRFRFITILFLTLGVLLSGVQPAGAFPGLPSTFTGTVTLNGAPVIAGTVVSAWINGYDCAEATVVPVPPDMKYVLKVRTEDLDDPTSIHCGVNGDIVTFHIGAIVADETGIFASGSTPVILNLSATTAACYTLTLNSGANGSAPTASPSNSTGCSAGQYKAGASISLTAHPASGYQTASWTGTDNDTLKTLTNTLTMPAGIRTVTVNYEVIPPVCYTLTTAVNPAGSGIVGASPMTNCTGGKYTAGTLVTLTANAGIGYIFSNWSSDLSGATNPTIVTMSANRSVTANFTLIKYWVHLPLVMH